MEPHEILSGPLTLWRAPVGTAFPAIGAAPAGAWLKIGTSGEKNYGEDGVTISHTQDIAQGRPVGRTGPVKAWRDSEDFLLRVTLWDFTLEQYQLALNNNTVGTTAPGVGTAGFKKIGLSQGRSVATFALLARGVFSPYGEGYAGQYELPRCYQSGSPEPVYSKGIAGLELEFTALEDTTAVSDQELFGRLLWQHAAPLS
ncbi:hypothetical protein [Sphingobium lignivorans]|uniref:Uncharacterized protein n=1 Tax=Sphingobium lignivorans TaxID=2735886 RepID=A0ABR6NJH2_9SPHN|nr:hypothetical protein [Sphingobium lignivorans]MBB5987433.1 hypothetical protein [Sphingobium lignivorans]